MIMCKVRSEKIHGRILRGSTFVGAVIVAIAFLLSIILIMNWMLSSQQTYYSKPMVILKDLSINLTSNTINITLLNMGKTPTTIEKIIVYDLVNNTTYIVYTNGGIIDPSKRGSEGIVGYALFSDTVINSGEIVRIELHFNVTLSTNLVGLVVLADDIVPFIPG